MSTPTQMTAEDLDSLYDYLNKELFEGALPPCLLTLSSVKKAEGYYRAFFFADKNGSSADELAMNPEAYRDFRSFAATFAHEMTHVLQEHFGNPAKGGYHNAEWCSMMIAIGLMPYNTKDREKTTGYTMNHEIIEDGPFDKAFQRYEKEHPGLRWTKGGVVQDTHPEDPEQKKEREEAERKKEERKEKNKASKTPFWCPECTQKVWGKPGTRVMCADCRVMYVSENPGGGEEE